MTTQEQNKWFFVSHLEIRDRRSIGEPYEVQVLDHQGRSLGNGYLNDHTVKLEIQGLSIPQLVIEAAKNQLIGTGTYVDVAGQIVSPF